ncbi:lysine N(6)-hydroxylase/L-ornithine N(5)-oxygenase family protein [Actinopolymorpha pittospori]
MSTVTTTTPYDLLGVGIGPFNLALAALADGVPDVRSVFLDSSPEFSWHPGLLFEDARLQVPFLADLVTLVDPTSPWSFLNYLRTHDRLFPFYFAERFHVPRREYDHYCRWVSRGLPSCRFGARVTGISWNDTAGVFEVTWTGAGREETMPARNVVLGIGTRPHVPAAFADLLGNRVFHAADYLRRRPGLDAAKDIAVIGSGQTGAEVFLDLLRDTTGSRRLHWLTRSPAFAPMEYSKLGLEHFTPDYTAYFRELPGPVRDRLVPAQWQLYKGISADTIAQIHDLLYDRSIEGRWPAATLTPHVDVVGVRDLGQAGIELCCRQREQDRSFTVRVDAAVLATGFSPARPEFLDPMRSLVEWDDRGRYQVDAHHRVRLAGQVRGGLYVQNAELHTHGVGTPDLGLGAHRAAVILNALTGRTAYALPPRTAFTSFGVHPPAGPAAQPPTFDPEDTRAPARTR